MGYQEGRPTIALLSAATGWYFCIMAFSQHVSPNFLLYFQHRFFQVTQELSEGNGKYMKIETHAST